MHFFCIEHWTFCLSTCSTAVISLQLSSAWSRLEWFWALRVCSLDRGPGVKPTFAARYALRLCWWGVLLLMSEGRDGVTWTDSYSCVLLVSSRGSVGLKGRLLLLCHSGSMRSHQSDEARGHHPFWWSCWCHDCIKPTYSLKQGENNYYCPIIRNIETHHRLNTAFDLFKEDWNMKIKHTKDHMTSYAYHLSNV